MTGIHKGDLHIFGDRDISGMVKGNLLIASTARVRVSGILKGDITVEPGASAFVSGVVKGRVRGDAVVTGLVSA